MVKKIRIEELEPVLAKTLRDGGFTEGLVIEAEGMRVAVVKRLAWDLTQRDGSARQYAVCDGQVISVDIEWDAAKLQASLDAGMGLRELLGLAPPPPAPLVFQYQCPACDHSWNDPIQ